MKYKPSLCPQNSPYGRVRSRKLVDDGIWSFQTDTTEGFCLSGERARIVEEKFGIVPPHKLNEVPRWWPEFGYDWLVVAAFYDELKVVTDELCYLCVNGLKSAAMWDSDFVEPMCKVVDSEVGKIAAKYASDNGRFYMKSSVLREEQDCFGKYLVMRFARQRDGHIITVRIPEEVANSQKYFSEAEASMFLVVPDRAINN